MERDPTEGGSGEEVRDPGKCGAGGDPGDKPALREDSGSPADMAALQGAGGDPSEAGGIPEETDDLIEAEGPLTRARAVALALAGGGESLSERPPKKRLRSMKVAKK